ncbi:GNAT family N-acetyltransferase [Caballeronia sp. EK]|uniref:GNAT family N-acetyltransferase n=1 Tax=Caballeronia sp. EK TaxID=2767469 RepID=UPI0016561A29|nr:GNAT family N-acetyltransferase [Caballeronia sp. EK]MBC8640603.1 GNAT family N-acetyltransferase [Caballeronia sp. EK]
MLHSLLCRSSRSDDLLELHNLSAKLRWPHRLEDWRFAAATGEVIVAEADSCIVGAAVYWPFGDHAASVGLVMSSSDWNAAEVEGQLMEHVTYALRERVVVLNSPVQRLDAYQHQGFKPTGCVRQFQGAVSHMREMFPDRGKRLRPLCAADVPLLSELATRATGLDRTKIMPAVLRTAAGIGLERDGALCGFSLIRRFGRGFTIGPVITSAPDETADGLLLVNYLLHRNVGTLVRIDLGEHSGLERELLRLGLKHEDTVFTMLRNGVLDSDSQVRQLAVISHSVC